MINKSGRKIISLILSFNLILQSFVPLIITPIYAEDSTPSAAIESTPTPTPEPTPEVTPSVTPESTPTPTPEPTPEVTPSVTPESTPTPTPESASTTNISSNETDPVLEDRSNHDSQVPSQSESQSQSPEPLNLALRLAHTAVETSPSLTTDKDDYFPTDTVHVSGKDFLPSTTYTLVISSLDNPIFIYKPIVTSDDAGNISFSFTLDGNYRPNYSIDAIDSSKTVVASMTFTDSRFTHSATVNGLNKVTVSAGEPITVSVVANLSWGDDWKGTLWKVSKNNGGQFSCEDTPNHIDNVVGTAEFTESFTINAPSGAGDYDLSLRISGRDNCDGQEGDLLVLSKAITVVAYTPTRICHATASDSNPYASQTPNSLGQLQGHFGANHQGGEDIIPPIPGILPSGQNWDTQGQAIWNNDCNIPPRTGSITIIKNTINGNDSFDFSASGVDSFTIATSDNTGSKSFDDIALGTYTFNEDQKTGWEMTELTCSGANDESSWNRLRSPQISILLKSSEDVTCTITNTYTPPCDDSDGDGVCDTEDSCPITSNPDQLDTDGDGVGDACDEIDNYCGDGQLSEDEACDDGNSADGDGCSSTCENEKKINICHYTNENADHQYNELSVSINSIASSADWLTGHGGHSDDIWPSFTARNGDIIPANGDQATLENGCVPPTGSISGYKWSDVNGNHIRDCNYEDRNEQESCEEKLSSWTITLERVSGKQEWEEVGSTSTDTNGDYMFSNLSPGNYRVCEENQSGWIQTYPYGDSGSCHLIEITLNSSYTDINFGNQFADPKINISKSNNASGNKLPGEAVTYRILVTVSDSDLKNLTVKDLLPNGFVYRSGSFQAKIGGIIVPIAEPIYQSPGTWIINHFIKAGQSVELLYTADISSDAQPASYLDVSWAQGTSMADQSVMALAQDSSKVDENFAGTQVNVIRDQTSSETYNVEKKEEVVGQVLGATTSLPATGANEMWLVVALLSFIFGIRLVKSSK